MAHSWHIANRGRVRAPSVAWRSVANGLALDPHTRDWISTARASLTDGTAQAEAMGGEEIAQQLDDARRDLHPGGDAPVGPEGPSLLVDREGRTRLG
jgi:hypothetical protein